MDKPQNRPLLYLDFLGFSEKILSQSIEESIKYYKHLLLDFELLKLDSKKINFDVVSDSAFIWLEGEDVYSDTIKLFQIASRFSSQSLLKGRPIRGAIIFDDFIIGDTDLKMGKLKIKTHLILGKGIIGGYRWEQTQDWFGISINPLYIKIFEQKLPGLLNELKEINNIVLYNIPTKNGLVKSYVINGYLKSHILGGYIMEHNPENPVNVIVGTYSEAIKNLRDTAKDFSVLNKLTNTEIFLDFIIGNELLIDDIKGKGRPYDI